ncbi:hypothetical protein Ddc_15312 [Ditylenchus destructor]|nr:hypothetical protein Ddc_15312 [Ditylenchus destructor]
MFPFVKAVFSYKVGELPKNKEIKSLTEKQIESVEGVTDYKLDIYLSDEHDKPSAKTEANSPTIESKVQGGEKTNGEKVEVQAQWLRFERFSSWYNPLPSIILHKNLNAQQVWKDVKGKWAKAQELELTIPGSGKIKIGKESGKDKLNVEVNGEDKPEDEKIVIKEGSTIVVAWREDIQPFRMANGRMAVPKGF